MYIKLIFITVVIVYVSSTNILNITDEIKKYFNTESYHSFRNQWNKYKKSIENAVLLGLQENFGHKPMNIYVRHVGDPLFISKGYHYKDNVLDAMFIDMVLREMPYMNIQELAINVPLNHLSVRSRLGKMFVDSSYALLRNQSALRYSKGHKEVENSPFAQQDVKDCGQLVIVAENCVLEGFVVTTLDGTSVNLGLDQFHIRGCQYSIEISSPGSPAPPVISQSFVDGNQLNILLLKPLQTEMMIKLQGVLYSYLNTSAIFGKALHRYIIHQEKIFMKTDSYMTNLVRTINEITVQSHTDSIKLDDWGMELEGSSNDRQILGSFQVKNIILSGVDTAYSSHSGGPVKMLGPLIVEAVKFHTMQVHGEIFTKNGTDEKMVDFVAEINDFAADVEIVNSNKFIITIKDWRTMEFFTSDTNNKNPEITTCHILITAYLKNELSRCLRKHLQSIFKKALNGIVDNEEITHDTSVENDDNTDDSQINQITESSHPDISSQENITNIENSMEPRNEAFFSENHSFFSETDKEFFSKEMFTDNTKFDKTKNQDISDNVKSGDANRVPSDTLVPIIKSHASDRPFFSGDDSKFFSEKMFSAEDNEKKDKLSNETAGKEPRIDKLIERKGLKINIKRNNFKKQSRKDSKPKKTKTEKVKQMSRVLRKLNSSTKHLETAKRHKYFPNKTDKLRVLRVEIKNNLRHKNVHINDNEIL